MFAFQHQQEILFRHSNLQTTRLPHPYQISANKLNDLGPIRSDGELYITIQIL